MPFYLAPYEGGGTSHLDPFQPVGNPAKRIDLRPDAGVVAGYALAWHPTPLVNPELYLIAENILDPISETQQGEIETLLSLPVNFLSATNVYDLAVNLLDPAFAAFLPWNPVLPTEGSGLAELHLGPLYWSANRKPIMGGATDDFNRADETPFPASTPWVRITGGGVDVNLTGNQLVGASGTQTRVFYYTGSASTADQSCQFKMVVTPTVDKVWAPTVRTSTSTSYDFYGYSLYGAARGIIKLVGNTYTNIETGYAAAADGDTVKITVVGSTLRGFINGVEDALSPCTDTTFSGAAAGAGFYIFSSQGTLDDFQGGDAGTAHQHMKVRYPNMTKLAGKVF